MSSSHPSTSRIQTLRKSFSCNIFGKVGPLPSNILPTYEDVIKCIIWERNVLKQENKKDPPIKPIFKKVAKEILMLYLKASIPTNCEMRVINMLQSYYQKYQNLMKNYKKYLNRPLYQEKIKNFEVHSNKLFDIAACKCPSFENCCCDIVSKVPVLERSFLIDQRNERNMIIGGIDEIETKRINLLAKRKIRKRALNPNMELIKISSSDSSSPSDENDEDLESYNSIHIESNINKKIKKYSMEKKLRNTQMSAVAEACDRTGISDRSAALICTSLLEDLGVISNDNPSDIIDRSKIRRAREHNRQIETKRKNKVEPLSIYFDGRKDKTLFNETVRNKGYKKIVTEEHITVLSEPNSKYLGHFAPTSGTACSITSGLKTFVLNQGMSLDKLIAVGCDGTSVNTGKRGGVIRLLEQFLCKPLHWFICQLHANELPLRHLIQNLDGKTMGPRGYNGDIGKQLNNCENLPVISFQPIYSELPLSLYLGDLSTDQKYLYDMHQAIASGTMPADLAIRNPGKVVHSRWLTTANRILRLYTAKENPSVNLQVLTSFIMRVYAPMWFAIKFNPSVTMGPLHLHKTIVLANEFESKYTNIIIPVIKRNAYFAHPENILLAMINDDREYVRELGWRRIKKARHHKNENIRIFNIPEINMEANDYIEMIDWQNIELHEPPATTQLSDWEIETNIKSKTQYELDNFPCHTQAVERMVKVVTEASISIGLKQREGAIQTKLASRSLNPKFETKQQYNFHQK